MGAISRPELHEKIKLLSLLDISHDRDSRLALPDSPDQRDQKLKPKQTAALPISNIGIGPNTVDNPHAKILLSATMSLTCNLLYALYHGVLGTIHVSVWFLSMCAFYSILAIVRFCAILCGRKRTAATLSHPSIL